MIESIEKLLGEELSKQVTEKLGTVELAVMNDGTVVKADKHDLLKGELSSANKQLEDTKTKLTEAIKGTESVEEYKTKLEKINTEFDTFKSDTTKREANSSKKSALAKLYEGKVIKGSIDLLVNSKDLDTITIDSKGDVVDGELLLKDVEDNRKGLWITENIDDPKPPEGGTNNTPDYSKMDDATYFATMRANKKGD